ncbi:MAG: sigma-54-dependent Fis family transcriptional regulator [Desulfobacterales bacterium]|nr:sigma-54-dependent Fis family transcriptional regulator [Desulfobacterales bacterium]
MEIDRNQFFKDCTLKICSSLEVEIFLHKAFVFLKNYIPADALFLTYYDAKERKHILLAKATEESAKLIDMAISIPSQLQIFIKRPDPETVIVGRAETHPTAAPWISKGLLEKDSSLIIVRLILDDLLIGGFIMHAEKSNAFTKQQADLISTLREPFAIALLNCIQYQELLKLKERLAEDNQFLHKELRQNIGEDIIGSDFGLKDVMDMVRYVAPLSSPVLLFGETGTGKEVIANAIHHMSPRKLGAFIKVNCGAIPDNLIDSELFGHEKGAFTGALVKKRGRFERADGGTIFLDEIGELAPQAQVRLLRVLQEKEIERVGGNESIRINVRIIAATHRDLSAMINAQTFREDLYFRINVFPITIPPLRFRKSDIPSLIQYFVKKKASAMGRKKIPSFSKDAIEHLINYQWPGNVRELENVVERALIMNRGEQLWLDEAYFKISAKSKNYQEIIEECQSEIQNEKELVLDDAISNHIRYVLDLANGKVGGKNGAAQKMQINPSTLRKKMKKLGIRFGRIKP